MTNKYDGFTTGAEYDVSQYAQPAYHPAPAYLSGGNSARVACTSTSTLTGQPTPYLPASQLHHTQQYVAAPTTPGPGPHDQLQLNTNNNMMYNIQPHDQMQFNANNNMMYNIQPMPHYWSTTNPNMIWIFDDQWKQVSLERISC
jgi:hypothetical protein